MTTIDSSNGSSSSSSNSRKNNANSARSFDAMTALPHNFVPTDKTVILGRGKRILAHAGNQLFKSVVAAQLNSYLSAESRLDKTAILMGVIEQVRENDPGGGFVKQNPKTDQYYEVSNFLAKEKAAQSFRDALHEYYSSSNPSKRKRRVESTSTTDDNTIMPIHENNQSDSSSQIPDQSLVRAMHHTTSTTRSHSLPSSPTYADFPEPRRSTTPPPKFSRFVSQDTIQHQTVVPENSKFLSSKKKRHSSVLFVGDAFAELSSAFDSVNAGTGDPFEPLPLDVCSDSDLPTFR